MADKGKKEAEQAQLDEAARHRATAQAHIEALKSFWSTFALTGVIVIAIVAFVVRGGFSWFASNSQVKGGTATISPAGQTDFALATVGKKPQGVYDGEFGLSGALSGETIGGTVYYIAAGNRSFRLDSDKNLNNYLANADLWPGNRGSFDLYVICRSTKNRNLELMPVFSAWKSGDPTVTDQDFTNAKEFLKGHILLFANMDDKGMYSGSIDYTKKITVTLEDASGSASQSEGEQSIRSFSWGERVYSDDKTAVYRLPIYWVWPEQFGNFIYTGNAYNKNLFASKGTDYDNFVSKMGSDTDYDQFFDVPAGATRQDIALITKPGPDFKKATEIYDQYSGWYNAADEKIGEYISYIQLGFELAQGNTP